MALQELREEKNMSRGRYQFNEIGHASEAAIECSEADRKEQQEIYNFLFLVRHI